MENAEKRQFALVEYNPRYANKCDVEEVKATIFAQAHGANLKHPLVVGVWPCETMEEAKILGQQKATTSAGTAYFAYEIDAPLFILGGCS